MKLYWARQRELRKSPDAEPKVSAEWRFEDAAVSLAGPDCGDRVTHSGSGSIQ
jgi:hypothetical protein